MQTPAEALIGDVGLGRLAIPSRRGAFLFSAFALIAAVMALFTTLQLQRDTTQRVIHSQDVLKQIDGLISAVEDAESDERGYLLTGDPRFLGPYRSEIAALPPMLDSLGRMTRDNPAQVQTLTAVRSQVAEKLTELASAIADYNAGARSGALELVRSGRDKATLSRLRAGLRGMRAEEERLLTLRRAKRAHLNDWIAAIIAGLGTLALGSLWLLRGLMARDAARLREAVRERYLHERQIAESEARFRILANNLPTLCWMADQSGSVFWYNSRWYEYTGATQEQMQGWGWQLVHDPQILPTVLERWRYSLASGEPFEMVFPLKGVDGTFRPFLTRVIPVRDADGDIVRWLGMNTDITRQQAAEAALRAADRRKDEFLAILAHELRNPLAPIRTAAQILASPRLEPRQLAWVQEVLTRQVGHMGRLLDDLLDVARITQGKLQLRKESVQLASIVDAAIEAAQPLIEARNHELRVTLPPDTPSLSFQADPLRLSQVLSNLLTNAAKYTDPGGHISLAATVEDGALCLTVTDDGIGIPAQSLQEIFGMFAQAEGAASRSEGGLGIGLAIAKGLVELHGGTVEARSEGIARGSTFVVRLPLAESGPAAVIAPARSAAASAARRVLVVDDNRDAADSLAMLLSLAGHDVRVAHGGRAALALAEAFRPDVVLLDIGMPDLDGYAVARALRWEPWGANICLVALTGWGQEEDRRQARAAGFDAHLTKPVDPGALEEYLLPRKGGEAPARAVTGSAQP